MCFLLYDIGERKKIAVPNLISYVEIHHKVLRNKNSDTADFVNKVGTF